MFLIHETNLNLVTSESGDPPSLCYLREPQPLLTLPHGQGPKQLLEATVLVSAHMGYPCGSAVCPGMHLESHVC